MRIPRNISLLQAGESGMSLIETILASAVLGGMIYFASTNYIQSMRLQAETHASRGLRNIRTQIQENLREEASWQNTVSDTANEALDCVRDAADCRDKTGPIQIRDAFNNLIGVDLAPETGFNLQGEKCTTFRADAPDHSCIFRYQVVWTAKCPAAGACTNPLHSFKISLAVLGTKKFNYMSFANFNFEMFRSPSFNYLEEACRVFTGNYNGNAKECVLPKTGMCPNGFVLTGQYTDDGKDFKVCKAVEGSCPAGQSVTGVDNTGKVICSALVPE